MSQGLQPTPPALPSLRPVAPGVRWYHISDSASPALDELAHEFSIHVLQVEDCRHRRQTARVEEHERYTFIVIKALLKSPKSGERTRDAEAAGQGGELPPSPRVPGDPAPAAGQPAGAPRVHFEDFDIFLGPDYVLTVDEGDSHLVESVARRIAAEAALQRPDRIVHALIDAAVDQYLPALDRVGELIDRLEDQVIRRPTPATLREVFRLKRELLEFRRVATAMREAVNALLRRYEARSKSPDDPDRELRIYYRDVYDHIVRVVEFVETYRDLLTGSLDIYLSAAANRTNEVMKILTLWGTLALPLLIITSFYGMNVRLPLQDSVYVLLFMGLVMGGSVVAVLYYFWRKHWF